MAITIASLKTGKPAQILYNRLKDVFPWFSGISYVSGYKDKAVIANYGLNSRLLNAAGCTVDSNDIDLDAKEVQVKAYSFSLPVDDCDLDKTWLASFANEYEEGTDVFIDGLIPYIVEQIGFNTRTNIVTDMLTEASLFNNPIVILDLRILK